LEENNNTSSWKTERPPWIKWVRRVLGIMAGVFLAIVLVLQFSVVQTWLISKFTNYISEATNTTVTAERVKFSPFDGLILQNMLILDQQKDTIIEVGILNFSLRKNIFYILNNELDLSYIGLRDVKAKIVVEMGEKVSNLDKFLKNLSAYPEKKNKKSKPLGLQIKDMDLSQIDISIDDKNKGSIKYFSLKSGAFDINLLDFECNEFDFNSILLDSPLFKTVIYEYECKNTEELAIKQQENKEAEVKTEDIPLALSIRELDINHGFFGKSNLLIPISEKNRDFVDYDNFYFENINTIITGVKLKDEVFMAKIDGINASDNTGYKIKNIKADTLLATTQKTELTGLSMEFGKTRILDRFSMSYIDFDAFSDFTNQVVLGANFKNSEIYIKDLMHFVKSLDNVPVFNHNKNETVYISGRYFGKINNLAGRDVNIKLGDKLSLAGSFNTRDLLDSDNTLLNVRLDHFNTSMRKLKMVIPNFNPPPNFYKLGSIHFAGRFDGYLEDFVSYGKLRSDIGSAEIDMRLDITGGQSKANYSGTLNLSNFNLGIWSGNRDFGLVNFRSKVADGRGLTLNSVKAQLDAGVKSLIYKGYTYKDFILNGKIDKNTFKGEFNISDQNIDLVFNGSIEYLNKKAFLSFKSDIKKLDLYALNLSKKPLAFKTGINIDIEGSTINDFTGEINMLAFNIFSNDSTYHLNKLDITAKNTVRNTRYLSLLSDIGLMSIDGEFEVEKIVPSFKKVLRSNYPHITRTWNNVSQNAVNDQRFSFNVQLNGSQNFLSLAGLHQSTFDKLSIKGRLDTYKNEISLASEVPGLHIKNDSLTNLQILVTSDKKAGDILIHIDSTFAIGKKFNPIDLQTKMKGDTIDFSFGAEKLIDTLESFDIKGRLIPHQKGYNLHFFDDFFTIMGTKWQIDAGNNIVFGRDFINFDNMNITDGVRNIGINDINQNKGLALDITNFNIDLLNALLKHDKMHFAGNTNVSATISDIFNKDKEISGYLNVPKFTINNDPYGGIFLDVNKAANQPVKVNVTIGDFIAVKGIYDDVAKEIDSKIKLRNAPLKILEYLLVDGIKNTSGTINADMTFGGPIKNLKIAGEGITDKGKTTLKFSNATYYFDQQKLKLTNTAIDLDGAKIYDQNGGVGTVRGGLVHQMFKNFGVNATITGNNVVGLNTTKADNPDYYGYGVGQVTAEFKGPFSKVDMKINATSGPGTKLYIPVGNAQGAIDQNFIKFIKKDGNATIEQKKNITIEGINIEMALVLTPDAEVSLIFNEAKGDIIRGTGRGNMKIDITRQGDFEIFGNYEIEQGQYLFTVANLPVAKPFVVQRGGRIIWTGDPINATLDMIAKYRVRTGVEPFITEYLTLAEPADQRLAAQNTEVDLSLKLGGTLYKPEIKFDLEFPNLSGNIANFTESKLRIIRSNELELNGQAMSLIVFKSFLPSNRVNDVVGASGIQSASINTLSEFLTSQLSVFITNILNSIVADKGLISGIDFDLNVRNNNLGLTSTSVVPDEIGFKSTVLSKDSRLSLDVGGNYVLQNQGIAINQIFPEMALEFQLTEDRKLKIRLYGKTDIDPVTITGGIRQKYGLGIAYRTEFSSMTEFENTIKKAVLDTIQQ
jgi:hypothetical protein